LTYFHLYWKIIILQDIYTNTVEKVIKIRFLTKCRRETRREAHLSYELGQNTDVATAQPTSGTDHAKMVERGPRCGHTRGAPAPLPPSRVHSILAVA
jgi:hypothetical protein